jgi:ribosomal-protein-alanine N-acetyltransferase
VSARAPRYPRRMTTAVIRLLPATAPLLDAAMAGPPALALALGCAVADGWDVFPEAIPAARAACDDSPQASAWWCYFFLTQGDDATSTLVGYGGFKGPPDAAGEVELGYSIAPGWRGRGLATAAARALVQAALRDPRVTAVVAHTLPEPGPSVRVLEKAGFGRDGEAQEDDVGVVWRFRLPRPR